MKTERFEVKEQIRSARSLRSTTQEFFHAADGIVAERQGAFLDVGEPSAKAAERERILLASVDDGDGQGSAELRATALGQHRQRRMEDRRWGAWSRRVATGLGFVCAGMIVS